jgi:hypothetical protein
MADYKTIISANISTSVVERLHGKTKGTRSRVIERALKAYLDDMNAFDITDLDSRQLMAALTSRDDISNALKAVLLAELTS